MHLPVHHAGARSRMGHPLVQAGFGVLAGAFALYNLLLLQIAIQLHGNDFGKFYYGLKAWQAGRSLYAPTRATYMKVGDVWLDFLNLNPPHFHLLLWPISALSLTASMYLWVALNLVSSLIAAAIVVSETGARLRSWHLLPAAAAVLACSATGAFFVTGQLTGLLLLMLVLAWRAARRSRPVSAGLWLGVLIGVKPFLGLFLVILLVRREWRTALVATAALLACFAVGVAAFGAQSHKEWIAALTDVSWPWVAMNGSWQALLARALAPSPYAVPFVNAPWLIRPFWLLGAAIVAVITLRASRRSVDHAFGGAVLGALLISPLGWVYYLWLALPGTFALWRHAMPRSAWFGLAMLVVPTFAVGLAGQVTPVLTLTLGSIYTWATFALWSAVVMAPPPIVPAKRAAGYALNLDASGRSSQDV